MGWEGWKGKKSRRFFLLRMSLIKRVELRCVFLFELMWVRKDLWIFLFNFSAVEWVWIWLEIILRGTCLVYCVIPYQRVLMQNKIIVASWFLFVCLRGWKKRDTGIRLIAVLVKYLNYKIVHKMVDSAQIHI